MPFFVQAAEVAVLMMMTLWGITTSHLFSPSFGGERPLPLIWNESNFCLQKINDTEREYGELNWRGKMRTPLYTSIDHQEDLVDGSVQSWEAAAVSMKRFICG